MLGAKGKENMIVDNTEINLTAHRRTIYLTVHSWIWILILNNVQTN